MEPLLEEDDIVVVDRADCDLKNIHENSIYAVVLYSTPFITLSWEVSVTFWDKVRPLFPVRQNTMN